MSFQRDEFEASFNRFDSRWSQQSHQSTWDRLQQPTVIATSAVLLLPLIYSVYGPLISAAVHWLTEHLWNILVWSIPSSLLYKIDHWLNPTQSMQDPALDSHAAKSAVVRRLMGLDRVNGIMNTVFQARSRALSITGNALGLRVDHDRPPGLGNRDNSCFQNSILQGLAALQPLQDYLSECLKFMDANCEGGHTVTQTLWNLLADLSGESSNGKTLWTPNKLRFMNTWTQQDAQEYYSKILDDIDKSAANALRSLRHHRGLEGDMSKDDSTSSQCSDDSGYQSSNGSLQKPGTCSLRNPLEGLLAQRVSCVQCGHSDGLSMIPFNCLTMNLSLDNRPHDLYERLDSYSEIESIEGVECYKCTLLKQQKLLSKLIDSLRKTNSSEEQLAEPLRRLEAAELALEEDQFDEKTLREVCKIPPQMTVSTTKTKQVIISRPPQSLAIHVNRSVFDTNTFNTVKNSAPVNFPMILDLGPWCLGSADSESGSDEQGRVENDSEEWVQDATTSMVAGDLRPSKLSGPIYELRSVVTHAGHHENGHYICYRKHAKPDKLKSDPADEEPSQSEDVKGEKSKDSQSDADKEDEQVTDNEEQDTEEMDWWRLSDDDVSKVEEETISRLSPGVFMLFYDCVDPSMALQGPVEDTSPLSLDGASIVATQEVDSSPEAETSPEQCCDRDADATGDVKQAGQPQSGEN